MKLSLIVKLSLIIYILHKQNIKLCNAKRQQNKKIDLISKETTLCAQHTSFVHSLLSFCMTMMRNFLKLPSYMFYGGLMLNVFDC